MLELQIVKYLNVFGNGTFVDSITIFVSSILFLMILWAALAFFALLKDKKHGKKVFVAVVLALLLHVIITEGIIKHTILDARTRPYQVDSSIAPLGTLFTDSSFPSSHIASTLAVLTVFMLYYKKSRLPSVIFIAIMAFARIHNGMHYPTDVLAGIILGSVYGILADYLANRKAKFIKNQK